MLETGCVRELFSPICCSVAFSVQLYTPTLLSSFAIMKLYLHSLASLLEQLLVCSELARTVPLFLKIANQTPFRINTLLSSPLCILHSSTAFCKGYYFVLTNPETHHNAPSTAHSLTLEELQASCLSFSQQLPSSARFALPS